MTDFPEAVTRAIIERLDEELRLGSGHRGYCRAKGHPVADAYRKDYLYEVTAGVPACRRCVQGVIGELRARLTHAKSITKRQERRLDARMAQRRRTA